MTRYSHGAGGLISLPAGNMHLTAGYSRFIIEKVRSLKVPLCHKHHWKARCAPVLLDEEYKEQLAHPVFISLSNERRSIFSCNWCTCVRRGLLPINSCQSLGWWVKWMNVTMGPLLCSRASINQYHLTSQLRKLVQTSFLACTSSQGEDDQSRTSEINGILSISLIDDSLLPLSGTD